VASVDPPQTADLTLFGVPNSANISPELIPWCTFNVFSVVNDAGKADVPNEVVDEVTQEESENGIRQ
jgi:hypothetical protein